MKLNNKHSIFACYLGYVIQASVNTIAPLLYAMFNTEFGISFELLGLIATVNFCVQILVDLSSPIFKKLFGVKLSTALSEFFCFVGLTLLGLLPLVMANVYLAIIIATVIMAIGGGLSEVFLSPIMQAIPSDTKEQNMLILHSFYGFGQSAIIILSTLFFVAFSINKWYYLPFCWALLPLFNTVLFLLIPIYDLPEVKGEKNTSILTKPIFWLMLLMMISAGASEVAIATWSSVFAELGLGVSKALGDIIGPSMFAFFMGTGRIVFSKFIKKFSLEKCLGCCGLGCFICYLIIIFIPNPIISLLGCALSGFFISIMWPSTYSLGAENLPSGGNLTFSLFAFGGDIGCSLTAYLVGFISDKVDSGKLNLITSFLPTTGTGIRAGLLICLIFPFIMFMGILIIKKWQRKSKKD